VITPTRYTQHHDFGAALRVVPDLGGLTLATLQQWHSATRPAPLRPTLTLS
jgi:hypothetical protein